MPGWSSSADSFRGKRSNTRDWMSLVRSTSYLRILISASSMLFCCQRGNDDLPLKILLLFKGETLAILVISEQCEMLLFNLSMAHRQSDSLTGRSFGGR